MIRTLNFGFIALAGLTCLGLYRVAEETRIAQAELRTTRVAIAHEQDTLAVLGAEWARLTQPARIQALASRHLELSTEPTVELSSVTSLPNRAVPIVTQSAIRNANATVVEPAPSRASAEASSPGT
jgi:hypothetical protein